MPALTASPSMSFDEACEQVTAYLRHTLPMGMWAVTEITPDQQIFLAVKDDTNYAKAGDAVPIGDTFCQYVLAGSSPPVAPDAMAVAQYAAVAKRRNLDIGSYVGVPITAADGGVFGTLCATDPGVRGDELLLHAPGLRLLADLLSRVMENDRMRAEAEAQTAAMRESARALARSEEMYRLMVSTSQDLVCRLTPDGVIQFASPVVEVMLGWKPDELVGRRAGDLLHRDDVRLDTTFAQDGKQVTCRARHRDGHWIWLESSSNVVRDQEGTACEVLVFSRDITQRRARDAASYQESKLESLGRLSAGLAHEINTPIQYVGDNARFLAEACADLLRLVASYRQALAPDPARDCVSRKALLMEAEAGLELDYLQQEVPSAVDQTLSGIDRVATIVRAMKTISHPGHEHHVPADLNEALEASVTITRHRVEDVADLTLELGPLPPVVCNLPELNQVFLNLIVNAADAVGDTGVRGAITITSAVDGADVVVSVSDTGGGIEDGDLTKIFDPFFTTKPVGKGTGQGLAMARDVVQKGHGGSLTVTTTLGAGSTFTLRLPIGPPVP